MASFFKPAKSTSRKSALVCNLKRKAAGGSLSFSTPKKVKAERKSAMTLNYEYTMGIFKKFTPGLGHDGDGLYGTLTNNSLQRLIEHLHVDGKTLIDIGAADGKVMLAGLALGAQAGYGIELAGDSLEVKFDAMIRQLRNGYLGLDAHAALKCNTDITKMNVGTISEILSECFSETYRIIPGRHIAVCAVWHGFNIEAKQSLLTILARSQHVQRFALVGPVTKDYGRPADVVEFMKESNPRCNIALETTESVTLSGGGEHYQAVIYHIS